MDMAQSGWFGMKGKPKSVFGKIELVILLETIMGTNDDPTRSSNGFYHQLSLMLLIIFYTGIRPGSMCALDDVPNELGTYLQWKVSKRRSAV